MHYYLHRYTSPKSQLVITALLTCVEVVINVSWLMYAPPSVTHSFPTRESRMLICEGLDGYSYMVGLLYPFVLIGNNWTLSCLLHQTLSVIRNVFPSHCLLCSLTTIVLDVIAYCTSGKCNDKTISSKYILVNILEIRSEIICRDIF
jgi:hypothetical protein